MNDWQELIVEELKSINNEIRSLKQEMEPIKAHVVQVRFATTITCIILPAIFAVVSAVWGQ